MCPKILTLFLELKNTETEIAECWHVCGLLVSYSLHVFQTQVDHNFSEFSFLEQPLVFYILIIISLLAQENKTHFLTLSKR